MAFKKWIAPTDASITAAGGTDVLWTYRPDVPEIYVTNPDATAVIWADPSGGTAAVDKGIRCGPAATTTIKTGTSNVTAISSSGTITASVTQLRDAY